MNQIKRRNYFIDKTFQSKFIIMFCLIVFVTSALAMGILLYLAGGSNTVAIENTQVIVKTTADFILPITVQTVLISFIFASLASIVLTVGFSHKISGPLFRLTREVDALSAGDLTREFKIRGTDQLQKFSQSLSKMSGVLCQHHKELLNQYQILKDYLESKDFIVSAQDKEKIVRLLKSIEDKLASFKSY